MQRYIRNDSSRKKVFAVSHSKARCMIKSLNASRLIHSIEHYRRGSVRMLAAETSLLLLRQCYFDDPNSKKSSANCETPCFLGFGALMWGRVLQCISTSTHREALFCFYPAPIPFLSCAPVMSLVPCEPVQSRGECSVVS